MRYALLTTLILTSTIIMGATKPKKKMSCEDAAKAQIQYIEEKGFFPVNMVPFGDTGIVILFDSVKPSSTSYALFFLISLDDFKITKDTATVAKGVCTNEDGRTLYYFLLSRLETEEATNSPSGAGSIKGAGN